MLPGMMMTQFCVFKTSPSFVIEGRTTRRIGLYFRSGRVRSGQVRWGQVGVLQQHYSSHWTNTNTFYYLLIISSICLQDIGGWVVMEKKLLENKKIKCNFSVLPGRGHRSVLVRLLERSGQSLQFTQPSSGRVEREVYLAKSLSKSNANMYQCEMFACSVSNIIIASITTQPAGSQLIRRIITTNIISARLSPLSISES